VGGILYDPLPPCCLEYGRLVVLTLRYDCSVETPGYIEWPSANASLPYHAHFIVLQGDTWETGVLLPSVQAPFLPSCLLLMEWRLLCAPCSDPFLPLDTPFMTRCWCHSGTNFGNAVPGQEAGTTREADAWATFCLRDYHYIQACWSLQEAGRPVLAWRWLPLINFCLLLMPIPFDYRLLFFGGYGAGTTVCSRCLTVLVLHAIMPLLVWR